MYVEIRFRQRLGLAHNFAHIAYASLDDLRKEMDLGKEKACIKAISMPAQRLAERI